MSQSKIRKGDRVEAGRGEDYDTGVVQSLGKNGFAVVGWDSGVSTPIHKSELRRRPSKVVTMHDAMGKHPPLLLVLPPGTHRR
jgi:hypothetical protein